MAKQNFISNKEKKRQLVNDVPVLSSPTKSFWGRLVIIIICFIFTFSSLIGLIVMLVNGS